MTTSRSPTGGLPEATASAYDRGMSLPVEAGRSKLDRRPGKETPCPQPFSTCPSPSTDSSPGPMRDRTTASVTASTACTSGTGHTVAITLHVKSYFRSAQFILLEDIAFCSKVRSYDHILTRRLARLFPPSYTKSSRTFRPGLSTPAFFLSMPFGFPRMASLGTWVNRPTRNN